MNPHDPFPLDDQSDELLALIRDAEQYVQPSRGFRADTINASQREAEQQSGSWRLSMGSAVITLTLTGVVIAQGMWDWAAHARASQQQFQDHVEAASDVANERDWALAEAVLLRPGWPVSNGAVSEDEPTDRLLISNGNQP